MAKGKNKSKGTIELKAKGSSRKTAAVAEAPAKSDKSSRKSRAAASSRRAPAGTPKGNVAVRCRECGYEFKLDVERATNQDTITCTVCEHRAQSPSNDILHQISLYKGIEHKNLGLAIAFVVIGLVSMVFWAVLTASEVRAEDPAVFFGPIGVAAVSLMVALVFGAKYERSRWETFF